WIPLVVLAGLSVVGGFLGSPTKALDIWLAPVVEKGEAIVLSAKGLSGGELPPYVARMEEFLLIISVLVALTGIVIATMYYKRKTTLAAQEKKLGTAYAFSTNKFYVDEIYDKTIIQPTYNISNSFLYKIVDVKIIDGIVNGSAATIDWISGMIRKIQTGIVQNYAVMIVVGILALVSYVLIF
ncbi:MAG: NADH-quinone oxidoreductase subunit L, partial [Candidatus Kapaibacterium sp.]